MTIKPLFEVSNLVQHKFQRTRIEDKTILCYEVLQIDTQTCMAGTQVFYQTRPLYAMKEQWGKDNKVIDIANGLIDSMSKYCVFREDELKAAPQEVIDIVLNVEKA